MKAISVALIFVLLAGAQQTGQTPAQAPQTTANGTVKFQANTQLVIEPQVESEIGRVRRCAGQILRRSAAGRGRVWGLRAARPSHGYGRQWQTGRRYRSEEHTSELQPLRHL